MKKWLLIIIIWSFSKTIIAVPFLVSDPQPKFNASDGLGISGFEISIDNGAWIKAGSRDVSGNNIQLYHDLADSKIGETTYRIRTFNIFRDKSDEVPFVLKREMPRQPAGIRVTPE